MLQAALDQVLSQTTNLLLEENLIPTRRLKPLAQQMYSGRMA
jgi:hypothetical protein